MNTMSDLFDTSETAGKTTKESLKKMLRYTPHHIALGVLWLALGISESVQHSLAGLFHKEGTSDQLLIDIGVLVVGSVYIGIAVNAFKKALVFIAEK